MNRNILLINPWIHDFAAYDLWMKPLGLLYLAAIIRKNNCRVSMIDCLDWRGSKPGKGGPSLIVKRKEDGSGRLPRSVISKPSQLNFIKRRYCRYGISPELFIAKLSQIPKPDLILITSLMTYWYPGVFEAISLIRNVFPAVPIMLGGIYATLCPGHARAYSGADAVIAGPGEPHLAPIFADFLGTGLTCLPDPDDLDSYPYPALDLLGPIDQVPIRTSRGCPYRCTYCASALLNNGFVQRQPDKVADEIAYWHKTHNVRHFSVYDDAFLINPKQVGIPLLKEIIKREIDCFFHAPNGLHLREITPEIASLLFQARFKTIRFGFETSNLQQQIATGSKVYNEELIAAVSYLTAAGYQGTDIGVYILTGLPRQRADDVRKTINFVRACGATPIIAEYSPVPSTALWNSALAASPFDLASEPLFHNNTILPCQSDSLTYSMCQSLKQLARGKNNSAGQQTDPKPDRICR